MSEGTGDNPTDGGNVYASAEESRQYRGTSYMPTNYDNLDVAPDVEEYPDRGDGDGHRLLDLPRVPKLKYVLGPSAIMLGASLGSGETLFWPTLIAEHGWALYWAFFVGVLTQFVINTEIQRWTVATGESVFRAFERLSGFWPLLLLALGFISLGWPGWAATAARIGAIGLGMEDVSVTVPFAELVGWKLFGILLMVVIWLTYHLTPVMYNVVERIQIVLVVLGVLCAFGLFVALGSINELAKVPRAVGGVGTIPPNQEIAVFLGGLAYAGAGGYLNLAQSLWVREKGYGMGRYMGRVKNPVVGDDPEPIQRNGFTFPVNVTNLRRWRGWWRLVQLEHFLTFVFGLLFAATIMMAVASEYAAGTTTGGVTMWATEIAPQVGTVGRTLIFLTLFIALFTTEYAIVESFVRNSADIIYEQFGRTYGWSQARIFWLLLTVFSAWGILILALPIPVEQPFGLLVVAAAMSGVMMWPYTVLVLVVNVTRLPQHTQPGWPRIVGLWWASSFFGYFSVLLLGQTIERGTGSGWFRAAPAVLGSDPGGYLLFAVFAVIQAIAIVTTIRGKLRTKATVPDAEEAHGWLR
ncbi:Nramp family divalent metal transporter [Haloarculaceae archaeon H-GB2-1]|nr:Nramp family divalent metal transporter [Haloarculaceae archaeon H-GB1-1]MEA5387169.1 Nramp family divalent metal transporter [Haloarculaceae archaeon H-GB11]MEA5408661.1 Nramp family divalent metal transporter [Haloarculaceae archaeon H-GB2-1]